MKKFTTTVLFISLAFDLFAQVNLVPDASFEDTISCPGDTSQILFTTHWNSPSTASPDYFHSCNQSNVSIPANLYGYESAKTGKAYAGFVTYSASKSNYREYLQISLNDTMKEGRLYCISFHLSLAEKSGYSTNNIGAVLTPSPISVTQPSLIQEEFAINKVSVVNNVDGWAKVSGRMTAAGGETNLIIGNFLPDSSTIVELISSSDTIAYYYIDDVEVFSCATQQTLITFPNVFSPNGDQVNDSFVAFISSVRSYYFDVYNRWGEKVYSFSQDEEVNDPVLWDGTNHSGHNVPDGVYYFIFNGKGLYGTPISASGTLQLLR